MSSHLEQLLTNVRLNMEDFQKYATSYRAKTAALSYELLKHLIQDSSKDVFSMTKKDFADCVRKEFNVDPERVKDVAKFLFVHAQSCLDQERLAPYYKQAEELMKKHNF